MCESYNLQYGTNFISVMPTNLYGPNDNFNLENSHVFPALIRKIHLAYCLSNDDWDLIRLDLNKNPINNIDGNFSKEEIISIFQYYGITKNKVEIWGSGSPRREFMWSEDMADACVFLLENINFNKKETGQVKNTHINLGTGVDVSIKDLAIKIKEHIGYMGDFYFNTSKPDGTIRKVTDVSKLNSFGWKYKTSLLEGIEKMYNCYISSLT